MTEKLAELYLAELLRNTQFHGKIHLLDEMGLLADVVILDEESEGMVSQITGSEVETSHELTE